MSILKTIPITLDLKRVGAQSQALPTLVEGDNGNVFEITMTDDGAALDLSTATRVICVFSKTSDGKTVEQDTEDANVSLDDYGITVTGDPSLNDTITVVSTSTSISSVTVSGSITAASVDDTDTFFEKFPDGGTFVFVYNGTSWQYGTHSVTIGGTNNNVVTVELKSGSFGAGTNNCEVQVYSGSDGDILVTSANFNFKGKKGIMNDETIQSEENYPILVSLINKVSRIEAQHVLSVNGYTGDVVLTYTDVGAVPTDRTVNGYALSADITLDADDIETDTVGISVQDKLDSINSTVSTQGNSITTLSNNLAKKTVLHFTSIACSAMTGDFATISDNAITANHVVLEMTFADPNYITSDVTWTTVAGSLVLNGTCATATTVDVVLAYKDN